MTAALPNGPSSPITHTATCVNPDCAEYGMKGRVPESIMAGRGGLPILCGACAQPREIAEGAPAEEGI